MTTNCYWITGLAGAGKTSLARAVVATLQARGERPVLLDGDELRAVFGERLGYDKADRLMLAMSYARLCAMLVKQGFTVVIATISLFKTVHEWNRNNIPGYVEVLLEVPAEVLQQRDQKGLYSRARAGQEQHVAGVTEHYEFPEAADVVLKTDGSQSVASLTDTLFTALGQADAALSRESAKSVQ